MVARVITMTRISCKEDLGINGTALPEKSVRPWKHL
jgi:hypothetical protein